MCERGREKGKSEKKTYIKRIGRDNEKFSVIRFYPQDF